MATPCALFLSCAENNNPNELIKQVLKNSDVAPKDTVDDEDIQIYDWHIDTKYYTADIHLCSKGKKSLVSQQFAESVQAVLLYFDSTHEQGLESVIQWMSFIKEYEPDVRLLVCNSCTTDTTMKRDRVQQWCIENSFELVETNPCLDSDDETEEDFPETIGIDRIIQALHAHTWTNMVMKANGCCPDERITLNIPDRPKYDPHRRTSNTTQEDIPSHVPDNDSTSEAAPAATAEAVSTPSGDSTKPSSSADTSSRARVDQLLGQSEASVWDELREEEHGEFEFERLMERMHSMKQQASELPQEERKKFAEEVAVSFWRALGGDEEEIAGLSDDSDS